MKKTSFRVLVLAAILCLLAVTALAEGTEFNAGLAITRTETSISVTVQDSEVLTNEVPRLTIPCPGWTYAKVTFGGTEVRNVTWDAASESVTFPVAQGGTYVIEKAAAPKPVVPGTVEQPPVTTLPFNDVMPGDWFFEDVLFVWNKGLMNGVGGDRFDPYATVSRAMLVTTLWRLAGSPQAAADAAFTDVPSGAWYAQAVAWAAENGIVKGYGSTFDPDGAITREQLAAMLLRYAIFNGMEAVTLAEHLSGYPDANQVSEWAVSAMNWAVGSGLINGLDGNLAPQGSATRAQTAAILARFCR